MTCEPPSGPGSASMSLMFEKVMPLAQELNGIWYSTEEEGECKGDQRPGDGTCFWRLVENTRVVNASCGECSSGSLQRLSAAPRRPRPPAPPQAVV